MITCKVTKKALICVIDRENYYRKYVFPLVPVTREEVQKIRLIDSGKKYFLLKEGPLLNLADISDLPSNTRVSVAFADRVITHLCPSCRYQSALPDEQGGCQKCRQRASMLELVDNILLAYETWGTQGADVLDVVKCARYREDLISIPDTKSNSQPDKRSHSWRDRKANQYLGYELIG